MSVQKRNSFLFYRSFFEAIDNLSDGEQLSIYQAITTYALNGNEPELSGYSKSIFCLIRPQIDANTKKWENGKKGADFGIKGGRPLKEKPQENPTITPEKPQKNPTRTPNVNDNVNVEYNIGEFENSPPELLFENVWSLYNKKTSNKKTSMAKWCKLSKKSQQLAIANIPLYVSATPDSTFRKNFETYLSKEVWNDEIITKNEQVNEIPANPAYQPFPNN